MSRILELQERKHPPIGKNDREFEIAITDKQTKRTYAMNVKRPINEVMKDSKDLRNEIIQVTEKLVATVLAAGGIT